LALTPKPGKSFAGSGAGLVAVFFRVDDGAKNAAASDQMLARSRFDIEDQEATLVFYQAC
jgi:hypothetical protein